MATETASAPQYFRLASLDAVHPVPSVPALTARLVAGDKLMAMFGTVDPDASLPLHSHPHEQITICIEGTVHFQVGDAGYDLGPGEGLVIPGGITHGGVRVGPEGCSIIEIFTPLRDEYLALMKPAERDAAKP